MLAPLFNLLYTRELPTHHYGRKLSHSGELNYNHKETLFVCNSPDHWSHRQNTARWAGWTTREHTDKLFICYITTAASINISLEIKWTNKYCFLISLIRLNMIQTQHILDPPAFFNQTVNTHWDALREPQRVEKMFVTSWWRHELNMGR